MTPTDFFAKWQNVRLSERSACQQHFCDLCDVLGHPKPAEADPEGTHFTFERGVRTVEGSQGWGVCRLTRRGTMKQRLLHAEGMSHELLA